MDVKINKKLYGLVLAGGKSSRMKKDKALLTFNGKTQLENCYDLLTKFCDKVFLSLRKDQNFIQRVKQYPHIYDSERYENIGPMGGILSAMDQFSKISWVVLACDLPFVNESVIKYLIDHRDSRKLATAFKSTHGGLPEPLCAIYEKQSQVEMLKSLTEGISCPRKFLINSDVALIKQLDKISLENINTPEDHDRVLSYFQMRAQ